MTVSLAKRAATTMRKNAVAIKEEILRFVKTNTQDYEVLALWSTLHPLTLPGYNPTGWTATPGLLASLQNTAQCTLFSCTCVRAYSTSNNHQ